MKPSINLYTILVLFLVLQAAAFGQNSAGRTEVFPRLEPDARALDFYRRGVQNPPYSWADLAEISLWASGADTAYGLVEGSRLGQINSIAAAIKDSPDFPGGDREKAEFILGYIHKNLLKSYSLNQSRVDTLLDNGRYNCVSSAVFYMILCGSAGLDASGVITRDHAFVTVHIDGESIDVETTNPYGFDPGNRKDFHDQFGRTTGFAYVPARNYRDRQTVTPIQLISMIMSNHISELERRNRFSESIPLAVDRTALLSGPDFKSSTDENTEPTLFEEPQKILLDRLFNYGAFLLNGGREEECLRWAALAAPRYPDEKRWQEFILAAANNRLTKYIRSANFADAGKFLENQKALLSAANYAQLDTVLLDSEILNSANKIRAVAEGDRVIAAIEQARANRRIGGERASELLIFAVQKTVAAFSTSPGTDWLSAINYLENAIARYGSNRELEQALRVYRTNRATDFHNRFAAAWNRRNFDEARSILDEGLAEFPGDRQLLADREAVNKNRQ